MDISTITSLISTVGFPIVAVIACAWFIYWIVSNQRKDYNERIEEIQKEATAREDKMYAQLDKFNDTLSKFNETLIRIDARLCNLENKHQE
jgi:hypothetical protein